MMTSGLVVKMSFIIGVKIRKFQEIEEVVKKREKQLQRPKKWLVRGLVKFVTAVA